MDKGKPFDANIAMALSDALLEQGRHKDRIDSQIYNERLINRVGPAGNIVGGLAGLFAGVTGGQFGEFAQDWTPRVRTSYPTAYRGAQYGTGAAISAAAPPIGLPMLASSVARDPAVQRTARDMDNISLWSMIQALKK